MNRCPKCNSERLVNSKIASARGSVVVFSPAGQRFFSMSMFGGVQFADAASACLDCGLVATSLSAVELRDFVEKHCSQGSGENAA